MFRSTRIAYGQHRTRGYSDHVLRDAAEQQMGDPAAAMSAHDDEVDGIVVRILDNLSRRQSADDVACSVEAFLLVRSESLSQALTSILDRALAICRRQRGIDLRCKCRGGVRK